MANPSGRFVFVLLLLTLATIGRRARAESNSFQIIPIRRPCAVVGGNTTIGWRLTSGDWAPEFQLYRLHRSSPLDAHGARSFTRCRTGLQGAFLTPEMVCRAGTYAGVSTTSPAKRNTAVPSPLATGNSCGRALHRSRANPMSAGWLNRPVVLCATNAMDSPSSYGRGGSATPGEKVDTDMGSATDQRSAASDRRQNSTAGQ